MALSRFDLSVLRVVYKEYPIAYDPSENDIIAVGERPLLTKDGIAAKCKGKGLSAVEDALAKLVSYQCIAKVYLFSRNEFHEQWMAGKVLRMPVIASPKGQHCFQVTERGVETLNACMRERVKRVGAKWASKLAEEYILLAIVFLLGILLSSLFGFDIKKLRQ